MVLGTLVHMSMSGCRLSWLSGLLIHVSTSDLHSNTRPVSSKRVPNGPTNTKNPSLNYLTPSGNSGGNSGNFSGIWSKFWKNLTQNFWNLVLDLILILRKSHRGGGVRIFWGRVYIFTGRCMFSIQITGGCTCLIMSMIIRRARIFWNRKYAYSCIHTYM